MKKLTAIPFSEIDSIPRLIKDFLSGKISAFEDELFDIKNFRKKLDYIKENYSAETRKILAEALSSQMRDLELSAKQKENLQKLSDQDTFTVVTGHQLNLFTGPAFFIYKIMQTIKTAEYLSKTIPEIKVVPVFWMASEDHDFEEINHFKTRDGYYEIKAEQGGAVGRIKLQENYFIQHFEEEFKDSVYGTELLKWLKEAYTVGNTLAEATKILVNRIFSDYGLLIIDGDHPELKAQMQDIFRTELFDQKLFHTTGEKVEFLEAEYGKVQVNPREINLFYLTETRNRIVFEDQKFKLVDTEISFSGEELLAELKSHPENFSPNALMRPVYQEKILPNLAYIGGNAEIMYWMELKDYFSEIGVGFPILIPRNSFLFLTEKTSRKIDKLQLSERDFFGDFPELINSSLVENHQLSELIDLKEKELENSFQLLKNEAEITDVTFKNLVEAEEKRQLKSFLRMRKRLLRAEKIKQNEKVERLEALFMEVHPGGNWQERVYNFSVFYSDFGRDWLQTCYEETVVQNSELIIMQI